MNNRIICFLWPNFKYITTTAGNQIVKDPSFKNIENCVIKLNYEISYFCGIGGNRTMTFVLDLPRTDMMPTIAEPLFQGYEANVEVHPAMNLDDLKNVILKIQNRYL